MKRFIIVGLLSAGLVVGASYVQAADTRNEKQTRPQTNNRLNNQKNHIKAGVKSGKPTNVSTQKRDKKHAGSQPTPTLGQRRY